MSLTIKIERPGESYVSRTYDETSQSSLAEALTDHLKLRTKGLITNDEMRLIRKSLTSHGLDIDTYFSQTDHSCQAELEMVIADLAKNGDN